MSSNREYTESHTEETQGEQFDFRWLVLPQGANDEMQREILKLQESSSLINKLPEKAKSLIYSDEELNPREILFKHYKYLYNKIIEKYMVGERVEGAESASLKSVNLWGIDLSNVNLKHADLGYAFLENANLENANLGYAFLENANLENANLENANLENARLRNANLGKANLRKAKLENAKLRNANLTEVQITSLCFTNARFEGVNLTGADLQRVHITENTGHLAGANLSRTIFFSARKLLVARSVSRAILIDCDFTNGITESDKQKLKQKGAILTPLDLVEFIADKSRIIIYDDNNYYGLAENTINDQHINEFIEQLKNGAYDPLCKKYDVGILKETLNRTKEVLEHSKKKRESFLEDKNCPERDKEPIQKEIDHLKESLDVIQTKIDEKKEQSVPAADGAAEEEERSSVAEDTTWKDRVSEQRKQKEEGENIGRAHSG
ncbi:pentapeptide repeat-containing protein [Rickettsiales bacterium]|nr:pentapeptide repeat-containing protein [Rickettsiales bacterium]